MNIAPQLIIEVTSACNRACNGCYAPNLLSNKSGRELIKTNPELFISVKKLNDIIMFWEFEKPENIFIRGGEPSIHPDLTIILRNLQKLSSKLIIETHGRWIIDSTYQENTELLATIIQTNSILKISYDSMHRLETNKLKQVTSILEAYSIEYLIAITEPSLIDFEQRKNECTWIEDKKFIFQKKATDKDDLPRPPLGVINVNAIHRDILTHKFYENLQQLSLLNQVAP